MKKQFITYAAGLMAGLMCTLSTPSAAQYCPGTTVAGNETQGPGDAQLNNPTGVAVDKEGNIYVADLGNHRIQKFAPGSVPGSSGTTVAGITGSYLPPIATKLNNPTGVFVDGAGNIYVADTYNNRIQKFAPSSTEGSSGTTVAGITGSVGSGPEADKLNNPTGVAVDKDGNIYVADQYNYRIQKFAPGSTEGSNGTTVAGMTGSSGNGATQLKLPFGVAVDGAGNIYVADKLNNRIQKFAPNSSEGSSGTTVAGGSFGNGATQLRNPTGVAVDGAGNIYVADQFNHRIQKFTPQAAAATIGGLTADETGCPVRLRASGNGQQFVFTGPQGYVFSQVYRTRGDYQPVAIDVRQPGTYRLTADVSGGCGANNTTAVQTVTVTRSCP